eukprot:scpid73922/ scgid23077/ 
MFSAVDVDGMVDEWLDKFNAVLGIDTPYCTVQQYVGKARGRKCPFMMPDLLQLIRQRKAAYRKYCEHGNKNPELYNVLTRLRTRSTNLYRFYKNNYLRHQCDNYRYAALGHS